MDRRQRLRISEHQLDVGGEVMNMHVTFKYAHSVASWLCVARVRSLRPGREATGRPGREGRASAAAGLLRTLIPMSAL